MNCNQNKKRMKFNLINTFIAVLILICLGCKSQKMNPPNVIIILTDDQGWGDLSIKGNLDISTPNIDKLGKTGVQFDRFCKSCLLSDKSRIINWSLSCSRRSI